MSGYRPQQYNNAPRPQSLRLGPYCLTTELTGCPLRTANMLFLLQLMTSGALRDCCATLAIPVMLFATAEAFEDHGIEEGLCAGHLHHRERQPRRSRVCASVRVPCLSHQAILCAVTDRAAQESIGFLTLPKTIDRWFSLASARHSLDKGVQAFDARKSSDPPLL